MMPRISPKRRAAFDILDGLLFNQTWLLNLSEDLEKLHEGSPRARELIALCEIMQCINEEVASTGATGIAAQALKHTVYCILEAGFSEDLVQKISDGFADRFDLTDKRGMPILKPSGAIDPAQAARLHEHNQRFFMALITALDKKAHGVCTDTAIAIAAKVGASFSDAPTTIKYRLTERVFILEFMNAPVKFLSWMYRIGVLTSKKFVPSRVIRNITEDFKARVGLLCEFTLMRDLMANLSGKDTFRRKVICRIQDELDEKLSDAALIQLLEENDFYMRLDRHKARQFGLTTFNLARLADEAYLHDFLERFAGKHWRSRFWTGPQQSWAGVVGAGMICAYHSLVNSQHKITRNGNNHSKSNVPVMQEETVAQHICQNLNEHGLDCKPGSLYETYKECYEKKSGGLYHRVKVYRALQLELDLVFPAQVHDIIYIGVITTTTP